MRHVPKQLTASSWQYGATIIREEEAEYRVMVDFPWGDEPVLVSTHATFDRALVWVDRTEASFENPSLICSDCGNYIQSEAIEDEGYSYCRECAPTWNGVGDDRR